MMGINAQDVLPQVTTQLLVETQAGKKVRKLTKHGNAAVALAAAATVATWKDAVAQETRNSDSGAGAAAAC
jgi:hypothetical protein